AVHAELGRISQCCWDSLTSVLPLESAWRARFDAQVAAFPRITWQTCPWNPPDVEECLQGFHNLCPYVDSPAERVRENYELATRHIPVEHRDSRYFLPDSAKTKLNNSGFCWPYYYALSDWLLSARRNTHDFKAWRTDDHQIGTPKDSFSGIEEIIGSEE